MGNFVRVAHRPSHESVSEYIDYLKQNSPNTGIKRNLIDPDIQCTCCSQPAPSEAAAMIQCEDHTPTTTNLSGNKGETIWICADCFFYGVRPRYTKFGNITWNKEGRKIKKRAERHNGTPW